MADNVILNPGSGGDTTRAIDHAGIKTQVVALDFGGEAGPESLVSADNPIPVAPSAAYFVASAGNTSTAQLTSGATFTGTIESVLSQPAISIDFIVDQTSTITINQYVTSSSATLISSWSYAVAAGTGFSRAFVLNGNYANIVVTNNGGSTTTTLNLNTYYGTIDSVTQLGNKPVSINEIGGTAVSGTLPVSFAPQHQDAFNQLVTSERQNDVECSFAGNGTLSTLVTLTVTGTGAGAWANGQALFTTGATNPSTVKAVSLDSVAYRAASELFAYFTAYWATSAVGTWQRIGLFDTNDGFFVGYEGVSFGVTIRTGGSDTTTAQASFNLDNLSGAVGSKFTRNAIPEAIDPTHQNVFRIRFGWLGSAPIVFEVFSPDGVWVAFHTIRMPNSQSTPSIRNPNLPFTLWMSDTGTGLTMGSSCWAAGSSSPDNKLSDAISGRTVARQTKSVTFGKTAAGSYVNTAVDANGGVFLTDAPASITGGPVTTVSTTLFTTDTIGYNTYAIQLDGNWVGPIIFETSNDNANWVPAWGWSNTNDVVPVDRVLEEDLITMPVTGRYLRARTDATFIGSVTWVNYLRQQATEGTGTLPVTFDSAQTFPISGRLPSGGTQQVNLDVAGSLRVSDAPALISMANTVINGTVVFADTTGYQSISVQITSISGGTVTFYASNDGIAWFAVGGLNASYVAAPVTSTINTGIYQFPVVGRFFRATCNTAASAITYLRQQPISLAANLPSMNLTQVNSTNTASTGLAGSVPIGGTSQPGTTTNQSWPVIVAGVDGATTPVTRRILTDTTGAQVVAGANPVTTPASQPVAVAGQAPNSTLPVYSVSVKQDQLGTSASDGIIDALNNIVREIREMKMYLKELPLYLNAGINIMDEQNLYRDDPTNFSN